MSDFETNPGWDFEAEHDGDRFRKFVRDAARSIPQTFRTFERPEEINPKSWHKIENQSSMGSCQGHGLSSCMERLWWVATGGEIHQFSRIYAYVGTQRIDGLDGSDRGSTISGGGKLAMDGLPLESDCPYPNPVRYPSRTEINRILSDSKREKARAFRVRTVVSIKSHADAMDWLGGGGAISIGIRWPVQLSAGAVVRSFGGGGGGGHAIAILGYRKDGTLIVANSHSSQYGDAGWFYVTPQAFEQMLRDRYTACIGLSDMADPKPRIVDFKKGNIAKAAERGKKALEDYT